MISEGLQRAKYVIGDFLSSTLAWWVYTFLRYALNRDLMLSQGHHSFHQFISTPAVTTGTLAPAKLTLTIWCDKIGSTGADPTGTRTYEI